MKKYFLILVTLILCCCSPKVTNYGGSLHTENVLTQYIQSEIKELNRKGFNRICNTERIPSDLARWYKASFKDDETSQTTTTWLYIKQNDLIGVLPENTYKVLLDIKNQQDTTFILEIRKLKSVKK